MMEEFCKDVGQWVPTITPELLTGDFGAPESKDFNKKEVDGQVSWVTDQYDQG